MQTTASGRIKIGFRLDHNPPTLPRNAVPLSRLRKGRYYTRRYAVHRYWGRRPWFVVRQHIEHYTRPGSIVLDSFCGSGVTIVESLIVRRKAIGVDLNPMATFITKVTAEPLDLTEFKRGFQWIENEVKDKINALYRQTEDQILIDHWYPICTLPRSTYGAPRDGMHVHDLFSKRNLAAAAMLFDRICNAEVDETVRDALKFVFTASLAQMSKMERSGKNRTSRGWTFLRYWVPERHLERNAWNCFESKFRSMLRAKRETNELIGDFTEYVAAQGSATDLSFLPDDTVDYAFIDPPYSIKYLDLSVMWSSWLGFQLEFENEIFPSNPSFEAYITRSLCELERVLKKGSCVTIDFVNRGSVALNAIVKAIKRSGLLTKAILRNDQCVLSIIQQEASMAHRGDYLITLRKERQREISQYLDQNVLSEFQIKSMIGEVLKDNGVLTYDEVFRRIFPKLMSNGLASPDIHDILNRYFARAHVSGNCVGWTLPRSDNHARRIVKR